MKMFIVTFKWFNKYIFEYFSASISDIVNVDRY